jgi:FtsP/CotA-like multicopper oxidase with cupredoxin domain
MEDQTDRIVEPEGAYVVGRRRALALGAGGIVGALGLTALARSSEAGASGTAGATPRWRTGSGPTPVAPGRLTPGGLPAFTENLVVPPAITTKWITKIEAASATPANPWRFHSSLPATSKTWGYGGAPYLGPTLNVKVGQPFNLLVTNKLGAHPFGGSMNSTPLCMIGIDANDDVSPRISTHMHGAVTEPFSDGHPEDTILPGQTKEHYFDDFFEAKMLWYHDHALGITRLNVAAGLAGIVMVRDWFDTGTALNTLGLPYGAWEVPLVLQDKLIDLGTGDQVYPPSPRILEFFGDQPVVNGKVAPKLTVDRGVYRFRLLNASNARHYRLHITSDPVGGAAPPWYVIGSDHGLLDAPAPVTELVMGPGERYDVLVDFSRLAAGTKLILSNDAPTPFPDGGSPTTVSGTSTAITEMMQFVVRSKYGFTKGIPARLRTGKFGKPSPLPAVPKTGIKRTVTLMEVPDPNNPTGDPFVVLNNMLWDTPTPDGMQQGTTEIWSIVNATVDAHPVHLHLATFRVIDRRPFDVDGYLAQPQPALGTRWNPPVTAFLTGTAVPALAAEGGWKDTVVAYPGEVTRIAVVVPTKSQLGFDPDRSFKNQAGKTLRGYAWHCHILEHEDCDMMVPLLVTKAAATNL